MPPAGCGASARGGSSTPCAVTVRAGGINVLYLVGTKRIGGGPGAEQRFVRAAIAGELVFPGYAQDENVRVQAVQELRR